MALQEKKKRKIKVPKVVNGIETLEEIEVEDSGGPSWGPRAAHTLLNKHIERLDGPAKVTGQAKYAYDMRLPGMLYGRILRSPHACAEVTNVDVSAAEKIEGVNAILSMGNKTVKYEGEPVAAVAAITPEIAEDAIRAIKVTYNKLPHAVTPKQALQEGGAQVYPMDNAVKGNLRPGGASGDKDQVEVAIMACPAVVEHEFEVGVQHHLCLETHGMVVDYTGGDTATVYASTQGTFTIPGDAARELGLKDQNAVTALVEYMGGGFGSKFGLGLEGTLCCQLSKKAKAPVKLMLTRTDEFLMAGNRSGLLIRVKAGATQDGTLAALSAQQYRLGGLSQGSQAELPYIYKAGKVYREMAALHTHRNEAVAMRAPGHPQASFAMESIMDDLAAKLGLDPIEFRKKNLTDPTYTRQLDRGAKEIAWEKRPKTPGGGAAYGPHKSLKRGYGCGLATWGGGGYPVCQVDVFIKPDGAIAVQVGTQDLGTGVRTYTAAIVAEEFGLQVKQVEARIGSSRYGNANPSGGSVTTASLSPAVKDAAYNARLQFFAKVAPALSAKPEELVAKDGKIYASKAPEKALTWKQACAALGAAGVQARGEWKPELQASGVHGAQFAEVEVDIETGRVRVLKMVGVHDMGLPLNRTAAESQLNGGMIQALGYAISEHSLPDAFTGNLLTASMDDYKIPGTMEMPEMVPILDDGDPREVPIGFAESPIIPGHSAIANAVYNACGVRVTSLPITPDKILDGLKALATKKEEA